MRPQMSPRRRHRLKQPDDPLVPLHSRNLRAAMELQGWTVTTLARRLIEQFPRAGRENPQTLHHLAQGEGIKRCRQSRRAHLAHVLQAPEAWLGGGDFIIPVVGYLPLAAELWRSPRLTLAVGRLMQRCVTACERDLANEPARVATADVPAPAADVVEVLLSTIGRLISPRAWRRQLTVGPRVPRDPATMVPLSFTAEELEAERRRFPLDPVLETTALALSQAMEFALEPWLNGHATLNYERLRDLQAVVSPATEASLPNSWVTRQPARRQGRVNPPSIATEPTTPQRPKPKGRHT